MQILNLDVYENMQATLLAVNSQPREEISLISQCLFGVLDLSEHGWVEEPNMDDPEEDTASQLGKMGILLFLLL